MAGTSHPQMITFGMGDPSVDGELVEVPPSRDVETLGAKGAGLIDMAEAGLPVPPGFILPTDLCRSFAADGWTSEHDAALAAGLERLETSSGLRLGDPERPLLVSVRSGAPTSMPGMLDSILDVGMTDEVEASLADLSGDVVFAVDTHRRFLEGFQAVVGAEAPRDPAEQLRTAAAAVLSSHDGERARAFQGRQGDRDVQPTAVIVQQMVFGNLGDDSGSGVAYSRDPITGDDRLTGEFLPRSQGIDVVSGTQQALPLESMREHFEDNYIDLGVAVAALVSRYEGDVEVEFTVERGRLYLLQVRRAVSADSSPAASVPDPARPTPLVTGIAASPGRVAGVLCTELDEALRLADGGEAVVLVRPETTPADVAALAVSAALVTTRGGMTSHAAVVARAWGIPAVVGVEEIEWRPDGITVGTRIVAVGTMVTVDGTAGTVDVAQADD